MMKETPKGVNVNNPAVKRILGEYKELQKDPSDQYKAFPMEDNLFEWHFTIRGPKGTDFEGGVYHGKILLPSEYPYKPPDFVFLTPNGRFSCGEKICLTVSAYHPEHWQPSWSMRTALLAIIGFMPTKGEGAIGALDYTPEERKLLAKRSWQFTCNRCGISCATALPPEPPSITSPISIDSSTNITTQINTPVNITTPVNTPVNTREQKTAESTNVIIPPQNNQQNNQQNQTYIQQTPHIRHNNIIPPVQQANQIPIWIEIFREHTKVLDYLVVVLVVLIAALVLRKF